MFGLVWILFLRYEKIDIKKEVSGEAITQVQVSTQDVNLVIQESEDNYCRANILGEKAKADKWTLDTSVQGTVLKIESNFLQKAYLNYKDKVSRELIVSLPKKKYDSIHLKISPQSEENLSVSIQTANGEIKRIDTVNLKTQSRLETEFGSIFIIH